MSRAGFRCRSNDMQLLENTVSKFKVHVSISLCETDYLIMLGHFISTDVSPILLCISLLSLPNQTIDIKHGVPVI